MNLDYILIDGVMHEVIEGPWAYPWDRCAVAVVRCAGGEERTAVQHLGNRDWRWWIPAGRSMGKGRRP